MGEMLGEMQRREKEDTWRIRRKEVLYIWEEDSLLLPAWEEGRTCLPGGERRRPSGSAWAASGRKGRLGRGGTLCHLEIWKEAACCCCLPLHLLGCSAVPAGRVPAPLPASHLLLFSASWRQMWRKGWKEERWEVGRLGEERLREGTGWKPGKYHKCSLTSACYKCRNLCLCLWRTWEEERKAGEGASGRPGKCLCWKFSGRSLFRPAISEGRKERRASPLWVEGLPLRREGSGREGLWEMPYAI